MGLPQDEKKTKMIERNGSIDSTFYFIFVQRREKKNWYSQVMSFNTSDCSKTTKCAQNTKSLSIFKIEERIIRDNDK